MNEASFLNSLASDPTDLTTRLVYADWLEEQGRSDEAEYLRTQADLASLDRSTNADLLCQHLDQFTHSLKYEWRQTAGLRASVVLHSCGSEIIRVIKLVRWWTGFGLKEAKHMVESCPQVNVQDCLWERAREICEEFAAIGAEVMLSPETLRLDSSQAVSGR